MIDAMEFICHLAFTVKLPVGQVKTEMTNYRDKEGLRAKKFIWEGIENANPLTWWRDLRGTNLLAEISTKILSAPVTSAATERTFSTFSWIPSSKRNRLTSGRAAKITYLSHNWKLKNKANKTKREENVALTLPEVQDEIIEIEELETVSPQHLHLNRITGKIKG